MTPYPLTLAEIVADAHPGHRHATRKRATALLLLDALDALELATATIERLNRHSSANGTLDVINGVLARAGREDAEA